MQTLQVEKLLRQHKVAGLGEAAARQLFRREAGLDLEVGPRPELCKVEQDILAACGGLPLALQLMGGQLRNDTEKASWEVPHLCMHNVAMMVQAPHNQINSSYVTIGDKCVCCKKYNCPVCCTVRVSV